MTADKVLDAGIRASRYLGDYNERVERLGHEDVTAQKLYRKAQHWLDRYNKLAGNA